MKTLLIRLAAPLQSWGIDSKFDIRRTGMEPSKSGVIGMIAAALGIRRNEDEKLLDLTEKIRFGVRTDREGVLIKDFQTVKAKKNKIYGPEKDMSYVTNRYYLSDAVFVVGLESHNYDLLTEIEYAIEHPAFPLYLGRRSCPPTGKILLGIFDGDLEKNLQDCPMQAEGRTNAVRITVDADKNERKGILLRDFPISYSFDYRHYSFRRAKELISDRKVTEHDPMAELE